LFTLQAQKRRIFVLSPGYVRFFVGRDIVAGVTNRYGPDGPGIESQQIPVADRSKARVCGRSLAGIAGSNPSGSTEDDVVCVVQYEQKAPFTAEVEVRV
jgi:hypothetical protein